MKPESFQKVKAVVEGQTEWYSAREIALRAGVSYATVLGALVRLELQGKVECQSGKGWRVPPIKPDAGKVLHLRIPLHEIRRTDDPPNPPSKRGGRPQRVRK
jgi:hypothetical protein